jgi:hypothetical protein
MQQLYESSPRRFLAAVIAFLAVAVVVSIGVETASAGGGNSANAKQCYKDGWQKLVRTDGSSFANEEACVAYAAKGGELKPKPPTPTCTAGSENFSADADGSQPTTFAGGTIETPYGNASLDISPGILIQGSSWLLIGGTNWGKFVDGTHVLFTGWAMNRMGLSFTNAVASVQLAAQSFQISPVNLTLKGYDASNAVMGRRGHLSDWGRRPRSRSRSATRCSIRRFRGRSITPFRPQASPSSFGRSIGTPATPPGRLPALRRHLIRPLRSPTCRPR